MARSERVWHRQHGAWPLESSGGRREPNAPTQASILLGLQRSAGNRHVGAVLARQAARHKPDDAAFAAATARDDAARLRKAGTLSAEDRRDINAKLKFFQGKGHAAYVATVKPALVAVTRDGIRTPVDLPAEPFTASQLERMGQAAQINVLLGDIEKLKIDRILTWRETVSGKEPKPLEAVLDMVVAMTALGMGGVFGAVIAKGIKQELVKEFVLLAGLELVDKAGIDAYEHLRAAGDTLRKGAEAALPKSRSSAQAALAGDNDDLLAVYAEAMRLQIRTETAALQEEFNLNAKSTYGAKALLMRRLALKAIYDELLTQPQAFHRELTAGYVRLLDESYVATRAAHYGGDKARAWREDSSLHAVEKRKGNLIVSADGIQHSLGEWGDPRFDFTNFTAHATGANTKTLTKLAGTPIEALPVTLAFRYFAHDPFHRSVARVNVWPGGLIKIWFTRDAGGNIWLDDELSESALEWLASYHTGLARELTAEERKRYAPLGAKKLYEATKRRPIARVSNSDLL